jgi:hypothetical protein
MDIPAIDYQREYKTIEISEKYNLSAKVEISFPFPFGFSPLY